MYQEKVKAPETKPSKEEVAEGKNSGASIAARTPHHSIANIQRKPNNTGLPDNLRSGIENLSGHSMGDVKVHFNSSKPAKLQAHAYTQGTDIHVGPGQEKHLPHEAWHVVQQKQGRVRPTMQMKGKVNVNDEAHLEREADVMGGKSLSAGQEEALTVHQGSSEKTPHRESGINHSLNALSPSPLQFAGGKLTAKQRALAAKRAAQRGRKKRQEARMRRRQKEARIRRAERGFNEMINADPRDSTMDPFSFPFENRAPSKRPSPMGEETIDDAIDRLPHEVRRSPGFRHMLSLPDSAHGQSGTRTHVKRDEMREALAGWQYTREEGLDASTARPAGEIDYIARHNRGHEVPFDPFMSAGAGPGQAPSDKSITKWAQPGEAYDHHVHSKGGDVNTVGVWDKTYTKPADEVRLRRAIAHTGVDRGAKVHELRVPLARMYAEEHVKVEDQIAARKAKRQRRVSLKGQRAARRAQSRVWKAQNRARQQEIKRQTRSRRK